MAFENLGDIVPNAMRWAEEAARCIQDGVFWPPTQEVKYDDLAGLAPEGLKQALGEEWEKFLAGKTPGQGGDAA